MGWWWVLVVAVLLLGAAIVLGRLVWAVGRSALAALAELGRAGERLGELAAQVQALPAPACEEPAVFDDPARLRAERSARLRRARAVRRRARKRARATAPAAPNHQGARPVSPVADAGATQGLR